MLNAKEKETNESILNSAKIKDIKPTKNRIEIIKWIKEYIDEQMTDGYRKFDLRLNPLYKKVIGMDIPGVMTVRICIYVMARHQQVHIRH